MKRIITISLFSALLFLVSFAAYSQNDPFGKFVSNGLRLSKQEQYPAAIKEFDFALTISDTSAQVYYFKGMCFFKMKDAPNAIKAFEAAVKRNKFHINSYVKLLTCYRLSGDIDNTIYTYDRMFGIIDDPRKKTDLKAHAARLLLAEKKYDLALQHVEMGLQIDESHVRLLYFKGKILNTEHRYAEAQKALNKGLTALDWRDLKLKTQLNYELGYSLHKQEKYKESLDAFRNANFGPYKARVAMFTPAFYGRVAQLTATMHDYKKALELINIALAMQSDFAPALEVKRKLTEILSDRSEEIKAYMKVLEIEGLDEKRRRETYEKVLDLLIGVQQYDEAVKVANACLEKYPDMREVRFMKGMALLQGDNPTAAIQVLSNLLKADSLDIQEKAKYEFGIGLCYMAQDDVKAADSHFNEILKAAKDGGAPHYVKAALFERNQLDIDEEPEDVMGDASNTPK